MKTKDYRASIESLISEQQAIQQANPPTSDAWKRASEEIHRLASLLTGKKLYRVTAFNPQTAQEFNVGLYFAKSRNEAIRKAADKKSENFVLDAALVKSRVRR